MIVCVPVLCVGREREREVSQPSARMKSEGRETQTIEGKEHHQVRDAHLDELQNLLCRVLHLCSLWKHEMMTGKGWGEGVGQASMRLFLRKKRKWKKWKMGGEKKKRDV